MESEGYFFAVSQQAVASPCIEPDLSFQSLSFLFYYSPMYSCFIHYSSLK